MAITKLVKPKEIKNKKNLKLIKSARKKSISRNRGKRSKQKKFLVLRSNLCIPITKKPLQVRMGKGKGLVDHWAHIAKASRIVYEISRQKLKLRKIMRLYKKSSYKLPVKITAFYDRSFMRRETSFITKLKPNITYKNNAIT